jgi:hypothetical protein
MPSSQNRRRVEIPNELFEQLAVRAIEEQTTVAALATRLLREAMTSPEISDQREVFNGIQRQLAAIRDDIRSLRTLAPDASASRATLPVAIRPELLKQAKRELLTELRRDRQRDGEEGDGG